MVDKLDVLEDIIVDNAGPMGKFVIKKSMSDLGLDGRIPDNQQDRLLDMVLERAIFDESKRGLLRKQILSRWGD